MFTLLTHLVQLKYLTKFELSDYYNAIKYTHSKMVVNFQRMLKQRRYFVYLLLNIH